MTHLTKLQVYGTDKAVFIDADAIQFIGYPVSPDSRVLPPPGIVVVGIGTATVPIAADSPEELVTRLVAAKPLSLAMATAETSFKNFNRGGEVPLTSDAECLSLIAGMSNVSGSGGSVINRLIQIAGVALTGIASYRKELELCRIGTLSESSTSPRRTSPNDASPPSGNSSVSASSDASSSGAVTSRIPSKLILPP